MTSVGALGELRKKKNHSTKSFFWGGGGGGGGGGGVGSAVVGHWHHNNVIHKIILLNTEQGHASFYAIMPPDGQCRQQGFAAVTHTAEHVMAASWLVVVRALGSNFGRKVRNGNLTLGFVVFLYFVSQSSYIIIMYASCATIIIVLNLVRSRTFMEDLVM